MIDPSIYWELNLKIVVFQCNRYRINYTINGIVAMDYTPKRTSLDFLARTMTMIPSWIV